MKNEILKARIKKQNTQILVNILTDYYMDLFNIYGEIGVSANLLAEEIVNYKKSAGQLNEFNWVPAA